MTSFSTIPETAIMTTSGKFFCYESPEPEMLDIKDISRALGNICRFGGHGSFYSVAQHSVICLKIAQRLSYSAELQYAALMHDIAEAYLGDIPRPLKALLPDYREIEERVEGILFGHFGVDTSLKSQVKAIDNMALKIEKQALFPCLAGYPRWPSLDEVPNIEGITISPLSPAMAEREFLLAFAGAKGLER